MNLYDLWVVVVDGHVVDGLAYATEMEAKVAAEQVKPVLFKVMSMQDYLDELRARHVEDLHHYHRYGE